MPRASHCCHPDAVAARLQDPSFPLPSPCSPPPTRTQICCLPASTPSRGCQTDCPPSLSPHFAVFWPGSQSQARAQRRRQTTQTKIFRIIILYGNRQLVLLRSRSEPECARAVGSESAPALKWRRRTPAGSLLDENRRRSHGDRRGHEQDCDRFGARQIPPGQ